jgi:hypothetical protein
MASDYYPCMFGDIFQAGFVVFPLVPEKEESVRKIDTNK